MKLQKLLPLVAVAALLGACAPDTEQTDEFGEAVPTTPAAEESPAATTGTVDGPTLNVARAGADAAYLTDREGRAVYLLEGDTTGTSLCNDACLDAWPVVVAEEGEGMIRPGDPSVQESLIGRIGRDDGTMQVTYNKHPLYYYAEDEGAAAPTGHHVTDEWGEWYLVTPEGEELPGDALTNAPAEGTS